MTSIELSDATFSKLVALIYEMTGVSIDDSKRSLLRNRLGRRVRALNLETLEEYMELVQSEPKSGTEVSSFVDAVTTHKTSFFRTPSLWNALESEFVRLQKRGRPIKVWSAACSNGQEPYSAAVLLEHVRGKESPKWRVEASDVSPLAVERASKGVYDCKDVKAAALARPNWNVEAAFEKEGEERVVRKALRDRIRFKTHNLLKAPSGKFDVVFLRNVIIYFTEEDMLKVIGHAIGCLASGGLLVIGESESIGSSDSRVAYERPCLYRKK